MTGFFNIAEYTIYRQLNGEVLYAQDINAMGNVLFTVFSSLLARIQEPYDLINLQAPTTEQAEYFNGIVEFFNFLLLDTGRPPIAFSNLFNAFINIGTYDGFSYAAKAFLGDSTVTTFTLIDHQRLIIDLSGFGTQFFDNLVNEITEQLITDVPENLITNSQYFFEGNIGFVRLLLDKFMPVGVIYELNFIT